MIGFNRFPPDSAAAVLDMYDNSLAYLDAQLARLFAHLKAQHLWDSTVVVLTGDHGQAFYEHGFSAHGNLPFTELARAPLLIRAPDLAPGLDDRPAQHVDVPPTILSILGLPPHPAFQGIDLTGAPPPADRPLFVVTQTAMANAYAIIRGRYTLITDARMGITSLYDDAADPEQRHDVCESRSAICDMLQGELDMWRKVQVEYYGTPKGRFRSYVPNLQFPPLFDRPLLARAAADSCDRTDRHAALPPCHAAADRPQALPHSRATTQ
jgi:membrane-anchored protein YejM (alkaline phosphatase superfamily)